MKFSFSTKVPIIERLKILFLGGLFITINYNGQHSQASARFYPISAKKVTGNIVKEKS